MFCRSVQEEIFVEAETLVGVRKREKKRTLARTVLARIRNEKVFCVFTNNILKKVIN